ncbi:MAG: hypothetical protein CMH57_13285 [Myxococcales bacterium]|nr:hypothetical protein [Myxococcales bacterium]
MGIEKAQLLAALETRFDYYSARAVRDQALAAAGLGDKDNYSPDDIIQICDFLTQKSQTKELIEELQAFAGVESAVAASQARKADKEAKKQARAEDEAKKKAEAEAKKEAEAEAKKKAAAEAKKKAEAEAKAKAEEEAKKKAEAEAKKKAEAEAKKKAEAEAKAKAEAEAKKKAEEEAKAKAEAEAKAKAEAKKKAEAEAKKKAEDEAKAKAEAEKKAEAEAKKKDAKDDKKDAKDDKKDAKDDKKDAKGDKKDAKDDEPVEVKFMILTETEDKQKVFLCGNAKEMGDWKLDKALECKLNDDDVWVGSMKAPRGTRLEFKFVKTMDGADPVWQDGDNHTFEVPAKGDAVYEVAW